MILKRVKLQVPQPRPEILRRQRLHNFFTEHQHHKLLLLCAPAGYGKSTAVIDYANDTRASMCWYSLDEADLSPSVFLRYLTESIRHRFPGFGAHTLHMLETVGRGESGGSGEHHMDARLSEVMEVLLKDLGEVVPCRFVIVLNDYHRVDSDGINTVMTKFLHSLPENGQVIILSREVPMLAFLQRAAQQEIAGLGITELRFTLEETGALLRQHCGQEFSNQEIETLVRRFDGWIMGILLGTQVRTKQSISRPSGDRGMQISNEQATKPSEKSPEKSSEFIGPRSAAVQKSAQLQIFALGEPRVYLGDTQVSHWGSAKARELLLYFVASGTPQRKEVVMDALWPEALLPHGDWLFRTTLHRLRQAIGQDYIVYKHGLYALNLTYWYDVQDFRTALAQSQQLEMHFVQKHVQPSEQILATYRSAINLYGGDYCAPFYADWCSQWRDELRLQYVGAMVRLAQLCWETGLQDESAVLWRRLLSIDNCSEDAHQGLMTYYATNGQRVMVARQYQCCLEALEEFGMPPSSKTMAVYQDATSAFQNA